MKVYNNETISMINGLIRSSNVIDQKVLTVLTNISRDNFVPEKYKKQAHHLLILHGRYVCKARSPICKICVVNDLCMYKNKLI